MKTQLRRMTALAVIAGAFWGSPATSQAASTPTPKVTPPKVVDPVIQRMEDEGRAAAAARAKDPKWKAATSEVGLIQVGDAGKPGTLRNFCLDAEGNILACYGASIRVYSPEGELLKTWPLEIKPTAIAVAPDRAIFAAGEGRVLKLDATGKVLASGTSPTAKEAVVFTAEMEDMVKEHAAQTKRTIEAERANMKASLERRRTDVTGLAATGTDVFMAIGSPSDFSYRVYRFSHALADAKLVVDKLRGCCSQMDIQARDEKLWIPHNARHAIEARDRDGKELAKFGSKGKVKATDFGGCCEPKNMRVLASGDILSAESGPPTCIKRFSADGKFKEVIAVIDDSKGDCVRVTVEMSPDGSRFYLMDTTRDAIRVFKTKAS